MLRILLAIAGAGILVLLYAALLERNWYALRRHRVPCLPPGAPPLRILHLSDLHLRTGQRRKQAFLETCARLAPDLVVGTGDFLGDGRSVAATVRTLAAVRGRLGSVFVLGSNDYFGPRPKNPFGYFRDRAPVDAAELLRRQNPWPDLVLGLQRAGWTFANNRAFELDGGAIDVVGLDDPHIGRHDLSVARPREGGGFRLAVVHSPDAAMPLAELGYDLVVSGHTHGGQVRVPGIGALVTNCALPRRMARGLHRVGGAWLHVNAGLGTSMYAPVRFACRPEVCLLELVPREEATADAGVTGATEARAG